MSNKGHLYPHVCHCVFNVSLSEPSMIFEHPRPEHRHLAAAEARTAHVLEKVAWLGHLQSGHILSYT